VDPFGHVKVFFVGWSAVYLHAQGPLVAMRISTLKNGSICHFWLLSLNKITIND
jgi:hypothetical protein